MRFTSLSATALIALAFLSCSNPFAPKTEPGETVVKGPAPDANTPEILMDNLRRAMRDRDKDLYESVLDPSFWFTETDCAGDLVLANGFEQEIEFLGGSRDGSREGIFDIFREFEYDFQLIQEYIELGPDYPEAFEGDPDGHPEEDWQVFRGRVQMLMLDENGDGFRVDQIMTYKLRLADNGLWKIVRWIDDPLSGDCGAGKLITKRQNWSYAKLTANR
jgi:hypothetical protein